MVELDAVAVSWDGRTTAQREEDPMQQICLVLPVSSGRGTNARDFMQELEESRKQDYARSEERIGITKEVWYLAPLPAGEVLVAYMETEDFGKALGLFSESRDDFDMWFKRRLADATGVDLNDPPEMTLPELLSSYSATPAPVQ
ncbi:hypothetical protein [Candidatus Solirubrobacter pratensis]|uniref:hypothetical protein n=1 Tax=Candidatus Solirubrobacter pratensis TaxID=1298857 RepID=UPI000484D5CD|nr:hypothetical protein [Candidatus Solirubrobacter pratensis]